MVNMQTNRSPLETEPLTKLLFRYSVPTTLTLMVNYIYNIVDQTFCGAGCGHHRNGSHQYRFSAVNSCQRGFTASGRWLCG